MWLEAFSCIPLGIFTPTYTAVFLRLDQSRGILWLGVTLRGVEEAIVSWLKECRSARMERVCKGGEIQRYKGQLGWSERRRKGEKTVGPELPGLMSKGLQRERKMKGKRNEERAGTDGMKALKKNQWKDEKQTLTVEQKIILI